MCAVPLTTAIPSCWPHFSGTGRLISAAWSHEAARGGPKASDTEPVDAMPGFRSSRFGLCAAGAAQALAGQLAGALCGMIRQPFQDVGEPLGADSNQAKVRPWPPYRTDYELAISTRKRTSTGGARRTNCSHSPAPSETTGECASSAH